MKLDDLIYYSYKAEQLIDSGLYDASVMLMDDDIREDLHNKLAPCTDIQFLTHYMERHEKKFVEEFEVN